MNFDPNKPVEGVEYLGGSKEFNKDFEGKNPYQRVSEKALSILKKKYSLSESDEKYLNYKAIVEESEFKNLREKDFERWSQLANNPLPPEKQEEEWAKLVAEEIEIKSQKN